MLWHIYQHKWRMGDMLIYDNAQFLHKRVRKSTQENDFQDAKDLKP